jgi:hypothetical protein
VVRAFKGGIMLTWSLLEPRNPATRCCKHDISRGERHQQGIASCHWYGRPAAQRALSSHNTHCSA